MVDINKTYAKGDNLDNYDGFQPNLDYLETNLSKTVVKYIENKVLSGEYKSGDKVNEYLISRELNISRAPIREAVKTLQINGILDFLPRKGSTVAIMSIKDVDEIFDIRISLEKDIIKIIKERSMLGTENISKLNAKAENMFNMASQNPNQTNKIYTLNMLDLDFHTYIWNLALSPRRAGMLRNMFMQLLIAMNKDTSTLGKIEEKAKEHLKLIDVLQNGTVTEAQSELEAHVNQYREELYNIEL